MEMSWFRDARRQARTALKEKGLLSYTDWCRLLNLQDHNKEVSTKELNLFLVLMEVASAEHVKAHWSQISGPGFAALLSQILEMAKKSIGKDGNDHELISGFFSALYQFLGEDTQPLDVGDPKDELLMLGNPMIKTKMTRHVVGATLALILALGAILDGEVEIDEARGDDYLKGEALEKPAAHWAHEAMGWYYSYDQPMNPAQRQASIDYWTWYIDVAFVKAVDDTNRLLS